MGLIETPKAAAAADPFYVSINDELADKGFLAVACTLCYVIQNQQLFAVHDGLRHPVLERHLEEQVQDLVELFLAQFSVDSGTGNRFIATALQTETDQLIQN